MRLLIAGLAGLTLALAAASSLAQAPAPAIAAAPGAKSVESTTIADLLADASAKAVLQKDIPQILADPRLDQAMGMTLRDIVPYSEGQLDDAKLAAIQKDLNDAKKP